MPKNVCTFPQQAPCFLLSFPDPLGETFLIKNRELKDIHFIDLQPTTKSRVKNTAEVVVTLDRDDNINDNKNKIKKNDIKHELVSGPTNMFAMDDIPITLSASQKKTVDAIMSDVQNKTSTNSSDEIDPPQDISTPKEKATKTKSYLIAELRELCKKHKLSTSGTKIVLTQRLKSHNLLSD